MSCIRNKINKLDTILKQIQQEKLFNDIGEVHIIRAKENKCIICKSECRLNKINIDTHEGSIIKIIITTKKAKAI